MEHLECSHQPEQTAPAGHFDAAADAAAAPAAVADELASDSVGKRRRKKGGAPPSAAMQAFLRSRREREKGIKAEQRREREGFLASLDELQCDALGERVDCKPAEWAERGAAATQSG